MSDNSKEKIMNVDYFDLCWEATKQGEGLYDEGRIERLIAKYAEEDFDALHWRISVCGKVAYHSKVMTVFDAEYRLAEAKELMDYDVEGIMYCAHNSHTGNTVVVDELDGEDIFGYNPPVVEAFKKRYGVDILKEDFDHEAWYGLLGEFLTQYLREVRAELNKRDKKMIVAVKRGEYAIGGVYPKAKIHIDWRRWTKEDIVDALIFPVAYGVDNTVPEDDIDSVEKYKSQIGKRCRLYVWYTVWTPHATRSEIRRVVGGVRDSHLDGIVFHEAATFEFPQGGLAPAVVDMKDKEDGLWGLVRELDT